uniref:Protein phosphatase 1 regulatory subunit 36 n=1 Tax=Glossina brevipalpis TaxID=37001 RepID=A0A1A9W7U0_9MUSC
MIRIHKGNFVPKYVNGTWVWNKQNETLQFNSRNEVSKKASKDEFVVTGAYKFLATLNQLEEIIFRQEYQRSAESPDADYIISQDVRNLVTFIAPDEMMNKNFLEFINSFEAHQLVMALSMYFGYFLKVVEFILIRRDEQTFMVESDESTKMKLMFSEYLIQYRLLVARAYSTIIMGEGDVEKFYHLRHNLSQMTKDKKLHEQFLAFCTQFIWITMHRRDYDIIEMEMNRLFRSEHFKITRSEKKFSETEASMLYGKNYKRRNYRRQNSPLIQELIKIEKHNLPILWLGKRKYRGSDLRIKTLEKEILINSAQLDLVQSSRGILGHPKSVYNTLLEIDWKSVRFSNFSKDYDPYFIATQPFLKIPPLNEERIRKKSKTYESYYAMRPEIPYWSREMINKWLRRNRTEGTAIDILMRCKLEIENKPYTPDVAQMLQ